MSFDRSAKGEARQRRAWQRISATGGFSLGSGLSYSSGTISIDSSVVALLAGAQTFTGTKTFVDIKLGTAGNGIYIKEGSNATMGTAVLVAGTVVVNNTKVTANSRIFLTAQTPGGTVGAVYVAARVAATSFTITSTSALDTSTVAWLIIEPA